jgi:hypothetical protein
MTTDSCPLATALWGARFAGVWLPFCCYTTWGDTTQALADGGGHSPMKTDQSKPDAVRIRMVSGVHESASNIFSNLLLVKLKRNLWLITLGYTPKLYMPYRPLSFRP